MYAMTKKKKTNSQQRWGFMTRQEQTIITTRESKHVLRVFLLCSSASAGDAPRQNAAGVTVLKRLDWSSSHRCFNLWRKTGCSSSSWTLDVCLIKSFVLRPNARLSPLHPGLYPLPTAAFLIVSSSWTESSVSLRPSLSWRSRYLATQRSRHTDSPFVSSASL